MDQTAEAEERIKRIEAKVGLIASETQRWADTQSLMLTGFGHMLETQKELAANVVRLIPLVRDIHEACTAERPPSPLAEALREFTAKIGELTETIRDQPEAMREVFRQEMQVPAEIGSDIAREQEAMDALLSRLKARLDETKPNPDGVARGRPD